MPQPSAHAGHNTADNFVWGTLIFRTVGCLIFLLQTDFEKMFTWDRIKNVLIQISLKK